MSAAKAGHCSDDFSASMRADQARIADSLGTPPRAWVFLPLIGVLLCYWRAAVRQVALTPLTHPLLSIRVQGVAATCSCLGELAREYSSERGTVELVPSAMAGSWRLQGHGIDHLTLSFCNALAANSAGGLMVQEFEIIKPDALLRELGAAIVEAMESPCAASNSEVLSAMIRTLLHRALARRAATSHITDALPSRGCCAELQRLIEHLPVRCGENLSVINLARELGLGVTRFNQRFRNATGTSPHQFLTRVRLARACTALSNSDQSIAAIALIAGFSSQSHLTTVFRKNFGVTPQQYRARGEAIDATSPAKERGDGF